VNWEEIKKWDYIVVAVSSEYHKKYDMVELDDIKQSLYQWFVEHPNKLKEWESIGEKDAKNLIYRSLRNQALDYCQRWKAKSLGYETSDVFYYDAVMIEALLPAVIRGEIGITQKLNLAGPGKPPAPAEGIATEMNLGSEDAARMRHNRAVKKLITRVGGFKPWLDKDIEENIPDAVDENPTIEPNQDSDDRVNNRTEND